MAAGAGLGSACTAAGSAAVSAAVAFRCVTACTISCFALADSAKSVLFDAALQVLVATTGAEVPGLLAALDAARAKGHWIAGYIAYEAGYALEPRLRRLMPKRRAGPLVALGVYDSRRAAGPVLERAWALEPEQAQLFTLAALLHDCGALHLQQLFPKQPYQDIDAVGYSVSMLQQQPDCPPLLIQMIEEHCLSLAQSRMGIGGDLEGLDRAVVGAEAHDQVMALGRRDGGVDGDVVAEHRRSGVAGHRLRRRPPP